jgi:hypothetical protein
MGKLVRLLNSFAKKPTFGETGAITGDVCWGEDGADTGEEFSELGSLPFSLVSLLVSSSLSSSGVESLGRGPNLEPAGCGELNNLLGFSYFISKIIYYNGARSRRQKDTDLTSWDSSSMIGGRPLLGEGREPRGEFVWLAAAAAAAAAEELTTAVEFLRGMGDAFGAARVKDSRGKKEYYDTRLYWLGNFLVSRRNGVSWYPCEPWVG